jgi:uncharacterized repeat protein (TIGR03803 family)
MLNRYFSLQPSFHHTRKHIARLLPVVAAVLAVFVLAAPLVQAQWGEIVLHSFCSQPNCTDGAYPVAGLISDAQGNLYGTTRLGGNPSCNNGVTSCGTVFEVTSSWREKVLHTFDGLSTDGSEPESSLVMDANGNLYGTTVGGGDLQACGGYFCGTVFVVTPSGKETVIYKFGTNPNDGFEPASGLVMDASGNFYGATTQGGNFSPCSWGYVGGCGTIFKMTPSGQETVLYTFCPNGSPCIDGAGPVDLAFGPDGNLYGTTTFGGNNYGTVFKVTPAGKETVLYSFSGGSDGAYPFGSAVFDANGNLYGTAAGGGANGAGTVFELTPSGNLTVLHTFTGGPDGSTSYSGLIMDKKGNFYGTTEFGGAHNAGVVFEVTPSGEETVLYSFTGGPDGGYPESGLVIDAKGNLYGTTGSVYGADTVFELTQRVGTVALSPTSLNFGNQVRYTTSNAQSVTLTNRGPHRLIISSITVSNDPENPPTFAISTNTCGAQLRVGQSCAVSVTFTPTKLGPLTGKLIFVENAPGSPQTVTLSGTGVEKVALTPRGFNFGKLKLGTTSDPKTFTLTSNLSVALTGITISTTGDFAVSATTCGTSLGGNQSCTISITFTPKADGLRTGELSVTDSASNSPQKAKLKGTGVIIMPASPDKPVAFHLSS